MHCTKILGKPGTENRAITNKRACQSASGLASQAQFFLFGDLAIEIQQELWQHVESAIVEVLCAQDKHRSWRCDASRALWALSPCPRGILRGPIASNPPLQAHITFLLASAATDVWPTCHTSAAASQICSGGHAKVRHWCSSISSQHF